MKLTYASVFAGIEAFSVAAGRIAGVEWEPVFFSEIEPFPCAVLAQRYPAVPNLGDIARIRANPKEGTITNGDTTIAFPACGIDILAGGSPCQDVSVAGRRAGMRADSGTRSALAFEYARLVGEIRPRVLLWENVPGVLSSNRGLDFRAFLRSLVELGYGLAWRVLDAQYARVDGFPRAIPQRRRRVWLVGCAHGDERASAQVLFEAQGLLGDSPPRREVGKGFAAAPGFGPAGHAGGDAYACGNGQLNQTEPETVAKTLDTMHDAQAVCVSGDNKASCDGENVGLTLTSTSGGFKPGAVALTVADMTHADEALREIKGGAAPTLQQRMGTGGNQVPVVSIGVSLDGRRDAPVIKEVSHTETNGTNPGFKIGVATRHIVRRLTPTECERLQGFPDGYTAIPWRGKPAEACPDSPRYRALGNSWATNCAEWVLRRIIAAMVLGLT